MCLCGDVVYIGFKDRSSLEKFQNFIPVMSRNVNLEQTRLSSALHPIVCCQTALQLDCKYSTGCYITSETEINARSSQTALVFTLTEIFGNI